MNSKAFSKMIAYGTTAVFLGLNFLVSLPAFGEEEQIAVDWSKMALSAQQTKQIEELNEQWRRDFGQLKPGITEDQRKIAKLLGSHDSDPLEIMSVQSSLARKREQLSAMAMANFLKKRQILNETQQHTLETMIRQAIAERDRGSAVSSLTQGAPDHIQGLMERVRNAWTVQQEH